MDMSSHVGSACHRPVPHGRAPGQSVGTRVHAAPRSLVVPWTREEVDRIAEELDKPLTETDVARRVGAGGKKFAYVEGWFVLDQSNRIFGATGWSCEIKDIQVRTRPDKQKGWYAKARVISRVTLKDGTYHEDISVAGRFNKYEAEAEMMACKTAVTDSRKRVLRCFGRALGNSVYDKASIARSKKPAARPQFNNGRANKNEGPAKKKSRVGETNRQQANINQSQRPLNQLQKEAQQKSQQRLQQRHNDIQEMVQQKRPNVQASKSEKIETQPASDDLFGGAEEDEFFESVVQYEIRD